MSESKLPSAVSPQELRKLTEVDDTVELATIINKSLREDFGKGLSMTFAVDCFGSNARVREKALQHSRKAGWKDELNADQRDGEFYVLSPR